MNTSAPMVLIVEDDESIRDLLEFMLRREGYQTSLAVDGREATLAIDSGEVVPALVVLDVMLPYIDGFQLIAKMRGAPGWKDVPVLMLTAKHGEDDIVKALDAGADDYVIKPFQPQELIARAKRLLKAAK